MIHQALEDLLNCYELNQGGDYWGDDEYNAGISKGGEDASELAREAVQRLLDGVKDKTVLILNENQALAVQSALVTQALLAERARERVPEEWTAYIDAKIIERDTAILIAQEIRKQHQTNDFE